MNKYQKLAGNTIIFAIGTMSMKLLSFFLTRLYTGCMTESEYGDADLLYQASNVLYPIVTMSMADAVIRFGMEKKYDSRSVFTVAIAATAAGLGVLALLMPLFNLTDVYGGYSFLLYVYCYFSCFRQIASNFVRAKGYVKLFAADGIFTTLVMLICNIIFLKFLDMGITGYILSFIISDFISFLELTFMAGLHKCLDFKYFSKTLFKKMLKYSAPLIPAYIMWWVTAASDKIFVKLLCGDSVNGVYSAANKIPSLLLMFTTLFFQAWQMSAIENRDDKGLSKFYSKIYGAYSSAIMIAAAGVILLVKPLSAVLLGSDPEKDFTYAYHYTPILVVAMVFQCLCQFLSSVYNVKKKSVNSLLTSCIAGAANIILNFLLIPKYGAYGAAIATALSYAACFAVRIFDARNIIPFKARHVRMAVNTVIVCVMAYFAAAGDKPNYWWLAGLFAVSALFNLEAVLSTLKKILSKGEKQ
ncbi:MAG: polysaccharide biosynthesis C-terminal domain-containing protein [Ruminococcus sp.]|nr:polysaccharide biosynthesis C-terminal domain-containing protein [Ruminococcus sp.]